MRSKELLRGRRKAEKYRGNSESYHYRVEQFVHSVLDKEVSLGRWEAPKVGFREVSLGRELRNGGWNVCNKR